MFSIFGAKNPPPPDREGSAQQAIQSGWLSRLRKGLDKTRSLLATDIKTLFHQRSTVGESLFEELEAVLISADVGVRPAMDLIGKLRAIAERKQISDPAALLGEFKSLLVDLLTPLEKTFMADSAKPFVIMVAGVNGAGKTTTIGKLAKYLQAQGLTVMLAAGDTFRAAAREQLLTWGKRNNVTVIAQIGGDSAAVIFDAIQSARARNIDVVIADTAGRLPTQLHLMEEIKKVKRVIAKADAGAPHEILLVVDANTGQNAVSQIKAFDSALRLTGLVVTKLDGTAKGGMLASLVSAVDQRAIPVQFIGVGEGIDDLRPFSAREFVDALL